MCTRPRRSSSPPATRVRKLKWWFLVLIVVGVLALTVLLFMQTSVILLSAPIVAYAQDGAQGLDEGQGSPRDLPPRFLIMAGVFVVLGIVYIAGIWKVFFSSNSDQIETATDLVKTLTGFFVGAGTGFLG